MIKLFKIITLVTSLIIILTPVFPQNRSIEKKIDVLLKQMTIEEKVGQLTQYSGDNKATGPVNFKGDHQEQIKAGKIGSMLNILGSKYTRQYQEAAMKSRLKIPLLFGLDVIHGYKTTFPIPLGEAASWDLEAMEKSARIAAIEASSAGIHWTFAPMVDIGRDPRWGSNCLFSWRRSGNTHRRRRNQRMDRGVGAILSRLASEYFAPIDR